MAYSTPGGKLDTNLNSPREDTGSSSGNLLSMDLDENPKIMFARTSQDSKSV